MTRMSKQGKRRAVSPKRPRLPMKKTGPKKERFGFKEHENALNEENSAFIAKVK